MKRIALKGGPRGGATVDVPDAFTAFTFPGGVYRIKGKTATWEEDAGIKGATPSAVIVDEAAAVTTVTNTTGAPELVLDAESQAALTGYIESKAKQSKPKQYDAGGILPAGESIAEEAPKGSESKSAAKPKRARK